MPDGPKTVSLMLRESLSCSTIIPVAVISFETEAILNICEGSICCSSPSSAHPYPLAYRRESLRITANEAPLICHCLIYDLTFLSMPSVSGKSDKALESESLRWILGLSVSGSGLGIGLWMITEAVARAATAAADINIVSCLRVIVSVSIVCRTFLRNLL